MNEEHSSHKLRSVGAVLAGALVWVILFIATSFVLRFAGIIGPIGTRISKPALLLNLLYIAGYSIVSSYVMARFGLAHFR